MAVTNYLTVDGEVRSEHRTGDTYTRDYVLDALGSVVEVFQGTSVVADASYKPYGAMVGGSWNMASYKFRWVGGLGYRYTGLDWVTAYVRARHYSYNDGSWTSVDPLWPGEAAYRYVNGRATASVDPSGMEDLNPKCTAVLNHFKSNSSTPPESALKKCKNHKGEFCSPVAVTPCLMTCLTYKESSLTGKSDPARTDLNGQLNLTDDYIKDWCKKSCIDEILGLPPGTLFKKEGKTIAKCLSTLKSHRDWLDKLGSAMVSCDGLGRYGYGINPKDPASVWYGTRSQKTLYDCEACVCNSVQNGSYTPGVCHSCSDCLHALTTATSKINKDKKGEPWLHH